MKLLFICTHNRCRSILSEAITNQRARGILTAASAGSAPVDAVLLEPIKAELDLILPSNFAMVLCPANEPVKSYERACGRTRGLLVAAQSPRAG